MACDLILQCFASPKSLFHHFLSSKKGLNGEGAYFQFLLEGGLLESDLIEPFGYTKRKKAILEFNQDFISTVAFMIKFFPATCMTMSL